MPFTSTLRRYDMDLSVSSVFKSAILFLVKVMAKLLTAVKLSSIENLKNFYGFEIHFGKFNAILTL